MLNKIKDLKPIFFLLVGLYFNVFYFGYIYDNLTLPLSMGGILAIILIFPYTFIFIGCVCKKSETPNKENTYMIITFLCNLVLILSELFLRCWIKLPTIKVVLNSVSLSLFVFFIILLIVLKKRTPIMIFCLLLAILNFADIYSDGFLIKKLYEFIAYTGALYRKSKDTSLDLDAMEKVILDTKIDDIRELIRALLLVSTSIIAVDRVWNLKTNANAISREGEKK